MIWFDSEFSNHGTCQNFAIESNQITKFSNRDSNHFESSLKISNLIRITSPGSISLYKTIFKNWGLAKFWTESNRIKSLVWFDIKWNHGPRFDLIRTIGFYSTFFESWCEKMIWLLPWQFDENCIFLGLGCWCRVLFITSRSRRISRMTTTTMRIGTLVLKIAICNFSRSRRIRLPL